MEIGDKFLITTDNWFIAPNGKQYRAVFGTVKAVLNDEEALGIKTNRNSSNWFVNVGSMIIAGCQIHYAVKANSVNQNEVPDSVLHEGKYNNTVRESLIFMADEEL